jgi:hypothetical protein
VPWPIPQLLPEAATVKVGANTPKTSVVVTFKLPEVPVIVKVYSPGLTELLDLTVIWLRPGETGFGEKDAVTPAGKPVTARFTFPVKPYSGVTST